MYLARSQVLECLVRHKDGHVWFRLCRALVDGAGRLQVDGPDALLALRVLQTQLEDAIGLCVARLEG